MKKNRKWELNKEWVKLGPEADVHFVFHRGAFRKYKIKASKAKSITNANYISPPTTT